MAPSAVVTEQNPLSSFLSSSKLCRSAVSHDHSESEIVPLSSPNRSFVLEKRGRFIYETRPIPKLCSKQDVIVRVVATGLCGSDVHYWQHGRIGNYVVEKPIVLGHESSGIVEACGPDVTTLKVGDRVALEPGVGCKSCGFCRGGRYNLCEKMRFAATPPYDGTLATYYTLPEDSCFLLPRNVSFEEGALVEPLAVAVHCCKLAGIAPGSSVLVMGAGPVGLLCCAVSRAFGASTILCVDVVESRLKFARDYAATGTYTMRQDEEGLSMEDLRTRLGFPQGPDVVIEATGASPCIGCGVNALKRGGTFVQAGLGKPRVDFPIGQICDKEATLKGSFRYGAGDYDLAIQLLRTNQVNLRDLITHRFGFAEAEAAFETVLQRKGIKCIIRGPAESTWTEQ